MAMMATPPPPAMLAWQHHYSGQDVTHKSSLPTPPPPCRYGLDLFLLSIDEGISGYRDDSLETVKRNEAQYQIPLKIVSYKDLYNWTMDEIVSQIGTKNNCTFCGVFRRQALDRGAKLMKADKLATGHNADDFAETVLLNILRGDVARWVRTWTGTCGAVRGGRGRRQP